MEACQQNWYYDRKIGAMNLKPGDLVLVKADAFKGKRKIKDRWEDNIWEVVHQIVADVPSYEVMDQCAEGHASSTKTGFFFITSEVGIPLCIGHLSCMEQVYQPNPHASPPPQEVK